MRRAFISIDNSCPIFWQEQKTLENSKQHYRIEHKYCVQDQYFTWCFMDKKDIVVNLESLYRKRIQPFHTISDIQSFNGGKS